MDIPTVLVVNDDQPMRDMLRLALEAEDYAVVTARDGVEGLALAKATRPWVIVSDAVMPVMDGPTFVRVYRAGPGPHAPVIALSAGDLPPQVAMATLADAVVPLPFNLDQFYELVAGWIGRSGRLSGRLATS